MGTVTDITENRGLVEIAVDRTAVARVRKAHFSKCPVRVGDDIDPEAYVERLASVQFADGYEAAIAMTNYPAAIEFARLVANKRESPLAPNAHHSLAWLQEKMGEWSAAAGTYRRLAELWPTGAIAAQALYKAGVAEVRAGRPEQARSDWTNLLARHPDSPFAAEALYARAM